MNDPLIEKLLSKAPSPTVPADLREKLIANIRLTRAEPSRDEWNVNPFRFKRWFPGLSFAAFLLTCLAVIGVELNQLSDLRRENATLRAQNQNLAELRETNAEVRRLRNQNAELDRLRKNGAEIQRLRAEISQLRAQTDGLAQLRAENLRLQAAAMSAPGARPDFFAEAKLRAERVSCVNSLKQLGLAAHVWANAHNGSLPADFISMTNEIGSWKLLQCPGDKSRHITGWAQVAAGDVSYQIYTAGLTDRDNPAIVAFECPLHHIVCMLDGSVQMLTEGFGTNYVVNIVEGRKVLETRGGVARPTP